MSNGYIFVLEDDDDLRELFTFLLEEENYKVKPFPNAKTFREGIINEKPDIILMDIMLPDGDGIEICAGLKADQATANIPIIMTSAHRNMDDVSKTCAAEDFIAKPFDINNLLHKVAHLIGNAN